MRSISYDVRICLPVKGLEDRYVTASWLGNITWNVRELIKQSSGWSIKNEESKICQLCDFAEWDMPQCKECSSLNDWKYFRKREK